MTCGQARPRSGLFGALVLLAPSLALAADPPAAPAKPAEAKPSQGKPAAEAKKRAAPEAPPEPPKAEQPPAPPAAPAPPSDPNAPPAAAPTPPPPPAEPPKAEAPPPKAAEKAAAPKKAVVVDEAKRTEAAHRFDRGLQLFEGGVPLTFDRALASELLREDPAFLTLDLGLGAAAATVWTCDLSAEYVSINADYTT